MGPIKAYPCHMNATSPALAVQRLNDQTGRQLTVQSVHVYRLSRRGLYRFTPSFPRS